MDDSKEVKVIPLESIKDKLPNYEEKKEEYRLRHYLYYHVIRKKKLSQGLQYDDKKVTVKFD